MNKKNIFIGVDGGGTKSKAYIEDQGGKCLGTGIGGPSNIRLSVEQAWNSIDTAIHKALNNTGISLEDEQYAFHLGAALAGVEVPSDRERFLAHPHPFTTLSLDSDAYAACLGAHDNKDGAIIIIGTGVNGYEVQNGQRIQVSGWGFPHDDIGGGAWLGLQATSLTLQWLDGRIDSSPMLEAIFKHYNKDQIKLVAWANAANSTQFAKLAPFVIEHVKSNDPNALHLIKEAAKAIDQVSVAMEKRSIDKSVSLPVCLFGGIAPFIRPYLSESLQKRLIERAHDAPVGAVYMIRNIVEHKK
jgi:glucosamine kinase